MKPKTSDISRRFQTHTLTPIEQRHLDRLRSEAEALALAIYEITPSSREQSLALTKLEECSFWTSAAIARNQPT